jgi:hypothetical protein
MLVAVCDQNFGNSTPRCSKAGPSRPGMIASRVSHSISSNGSRPEIVKKRDRVHDLFGRRFAALDLLDACHLPLPEL